MSKWILGLTGGIGSGKSTACGFFSLQNIDIIDADNASRAVVEPGELALTQIMHHFGQKTIQIDGRLNRSALRTLIFQEPQEKKWLEDLLHPLIRNWILQQLHHSASIYALLVSPLLFESGQHRLCNRSLLIDAPEKLQIERTQSRDHNTQEQIQAIISSQWSREQRRALADDCVLNDRCEDALYQQLMPLHLRYLDLAHTALK